MGSGNDLIYEDDATANTTDVIKLGGTIRPDQVWITRQGNDLKLALIGTNDSVTINSWYSGQQHQVERIQTPNGVVLATQQIDVLINAMAAFAPPAAGQTTLPTDYQTALLPVIAASWR